jgi:hypothetical protein
VPRASGGESSFRCAGIDAPATLHQELHHERTQREQHRRGRKRPQGQSRKRQKRATDHGTSAAENLRQRAESQAAEDRADIVDHLNHGDLVRLEPVIDFEKGRIDILRAVAEEIEAGHEADGIDRQPPMDARSTLIIVAAFVCSRLQPGDSGTLRRM